MGERSSDRHAHHHGAGLSVSVPLQLLLIVALLVSQFAARSALSRPYYGRMTGSSYLGREPNIVRHDQLRFLGDALMPGARPGLICSGVGRISVRPPEVTPASRARS